MGGLLFFSSLVFWAALIPAYVFLNTYRLKRQKRANKIQREIDNEISNSGRVKIRGFDGIESYRARRAKHEIKLITLTDVEIERLC